MKPILNLVDVSYEYSRGFPVLSEITAELFSGQNVGLIGENACGKSTLSRIVAGLARPTKGAIHQLSTHSLRVNYIAQLPDSQLFESTIYDELMLGARTMGMNENEVRSNVVRLSDRLGIGQYLQLSPLEVPYGLRKIIPVISCLVTYPDLIIIDEGTVGLDYQLQEGLSWMISEFSARGTTFILVSHDFDFLYPLCERFILLRDGRVIYDSEKETFWRFIEGSLFLQQLSSEGIQSEMILRSALANLDAPRNSTQGRFSSFR